MGIHTERPVRPTLIFLSLLLMLIALFTSRVGLSATAILFVALTCVHRDFPAQFRRFLRHPLLIGMALLFLLPLVSGLWSSDGHWWLRFLRIKLPLLLLPVGFAGNWGLTRARDRLLSGAFIALLIATCGWSLWQYALDREWMEQGYLRAQSIPTPLGNDRVRFSLLVCLGVVASVRLLLEEPKARRWWWFLPAAFFALYLHLLSVRTGLLGFYLFLLALALWLLFTARRTWALGSLALLLFLPVVAWFTLPTFQNRIRYMLYDLSFVRQEQFLPGSNDGTRVASLRAGWELLREHPLGVGMGDVVPWTMQYYQRRVPELAGGDPLYPSSEWLMYGGVAGWPGVLLFTAVMLVPFFLHRSSPKDRFFWWVLNGLMAFSFLFDIGLEVQYGVFIYAMLVLWWWKGTGGVRL